MAKKPKRGKAAPLTVAGPGGELLLYQTEDGRTRIEVRFAGETVWLSLNQMAELFQRDKSVISRHIKNIFEEGRVAAGGSCCKICNNCRRRQDATEVEYYNLDVIISVGYRVKSHRGTQFRIWATAAAAGVSRQGVHAGRRAAQAAPAAATTSTSCSPASATSARRSRSSGARCSTSTPRASTTIRAPRRRSSSSRPCRTRCTGRRTARRPPRSSTRRAERASRTWA